MAKEKRSPDNLLVPEQFPELNEAFYATKPWEYFNYRNHLLMLAAGAADRLAKIAEDGVAYKGMTYQENPGGGDDEDGDQAEVAKENFVIADSEALLHHASETLLRLYLAHEGPKPCPWLELARVRTPGQLKKMLEDRFLKDLATSERRARVASVYFGGTDRSRLSPSPSLASRLMESIWRIARLRYLDEQPDGLDLWTTPAYGEVMRGLAEGEGARIVVETMYVELDYYVDPADEQEAPGEDDRSTPRG